MSDRVATFSMEWASEIPLVRIRGVLDAHNYLQVRHAIVKAATDDPDAVIVVLDDLTASTESAWSVLTSASWLLRQWPGIPLVAATESRQQRDELTRNGIARYVPLHSSAQQAAAAIMDRRDFASARLRVRHARPRTPESVAETRALVAQTLEEWGYTDCVTCARCVTTLLVENVLQHTDSPIDVRIEARAGLVTIAVQDNNPAPAVLTESSQPIEMRVSGLTMLSSLSRTWGNTTGVDGKTVWADLGPENYLPLSE